MNAFISKVSTDVDAMAEEYKEGLRDFVQDTIAQNQYVGNLADWYRLLETKREVIRRAYSEIRASHVRRARRVLATVTR